MEYKLIAYRTEDKKEWNTETGNNCREYFENKMNKPYKNYYHKLFQKNGKRWELIASTEREI